jgi:hypothetical protein
MRDVHPVPLVGELKPKLFDLCQWNDVAPRADVTSTVI